MVALGGALAGASRTGLGADSPAAQVHGTVAPGFERVKDAFAANFDIGDLVALLSLSVA